jgi:hypothetical protein
MRMSDKPRRSISVGRAATVDDLNAGWELAHEIMHFGFLRESPASLDRREYRHLRRANRARHDRAFLPASTVWDEMLRDAVEAQVLSYLARAKALSVGLSKAVSNRSAFAGRRVTAHLLEPPCTDPCARRLSGVSGQPLLPMPIN